MPRLTREDEDLQDQKEALKSAGKESAKVAGAVAKSAAEGFAEQIPAGLAADKFLLNKPISQIGQGFWGGAKAMIPSGTGFYAANLITAPYDMKQRADAVQRYYDYYEGATNQNAYDKQMQETGSFPYMQAFWDATKHRWEPAAEGLVNSMSFGVYDMTNALLKSVQQQQPK